MGFNLSASLSNSRELSIRCATAGRDVEWNMKKFVAYTSLMLMFAGPASAADLYQPEPPAEAPVIQPPMAGTCAVMLPMTS